MLMNVFFISESMNSIIIKKSIGYLFAVMFSLKEIVFLTKVLFFFDVYLQGRDSKLQMAQSDTCLKIVEFFKSTLHYLASSELSVLSF